MNRAEPVYGSQPGDTVYQASFGGARNTVIRFVVSVIAGVAIALFLIWFMSFLIATGDKRLDETDRVQLLDFVRIAPNERVQTKQRLPTRPEPSVPPQAPPAPQQASQDTSSSMAVAALPTGAGDALTLRGGGISFGSQDGEYLPIVKIAAVYPMSARQRRIEGTCLTQYTVTKNGSVKDVSVVAGECSNPIFERVSIEAALKFKYKPRVVNGEAIEVPGVYNRFIFKIQADS